MRLDALPPIKHVGFPAPTFLSIRGEADATPYYDETVEKRFRFYRHGKEGRIVTSRSLSL